MGGLPDNPTLMHRKPPLAAQGEPRARSGSGELTVLRFSEVDQHLPKGQPGLYEIWTLSGTPLKVGIAADLRQRLCDHRASRQKRLQLNNGGSWSRPEDVKSKQSILAKHLYFDQEITGDYDLASEAGRRAFLEDCCEVRVHPTATCEEARELEKQREATGLFRYRGRVRARPQRAAR